MKISYIMVLLVMFLIIMLPINAIWVAEKHNLIDMVASSSSIFVIKIMPDTFYSGRYAEVIKTFTEEKHPDTILLFSRSDLDKEFIYPVSFLKSGEPVYGPEKERPSFSPPQFNNQVGDTLIVFLNVYSRKEKTNFLKLNLSKGTYPGCLGDDISYIEVKNGICTDIGGLEWDDEAVNGQCYKDVIKQIETRIRSERSIRIEQNRLGINND